MGLTQDLSNWDKSTSSSIFEQMLEKRREHNVRITMMSIKESLKKGREFDFECIVEAVRLNCWVSRVDAEFEIVPEALKRMQLSRGDFL